MKNVNYKTYIGIFLIIFISLVISRNLIVTGTITGEQPVIKIGLLKADDTNCLPSLRINCSQVFPLINDRVEYGIKLAAPTSFFDNYRLELISDNDSDIDSSIRYFSDSDAKAIFIMNAFRKPEVKGNEMLTFYTSSVFSFSNPEDNVFAFQDRFLIPILIIADAMHNDGIDKIGVVYVKSPFELGDISNFDYSDEISNSVFNKTIGGIAFTSTYYTENRSNITEIINLINSTRPEAIAFLGYGTYYSEFSELLSEISNMEDIENLKIFSTGWGTKGRRSFDSPETFKFQDVFTVEIDSLPEALWRYFLQNTTSTLNFVKFENPDDIHLDILGNEIISSGDFGSIDFYESSGRSYPYTVEGYIFVEIFKSLLDMCGDDMNCIKASIHENTFDTAIGKVKFGENGVIIRPYLLRKIDESFEGRMILKRYTLSDIEDIINNYNLDFWG